MCPVSPYFEVQFYFSLMFSYISCLSASRLGPFAILAQFLPVVISTVLVIIINLGAYKWGESLNCMAPSISHLRSKPLPTLSPKDSNIHKTPKRREFAVPHYGKFQ